MIGDLFPLFRPEWVLRDDGDVIVIDKPSGLSTHEVTPEDTDHAVARLSGYLKERGERDYLGIHQRLDKDTSGVLLFARRPEVNRALAAEFESRRVEKAYVAAVSLPRGAPQKGTLRGFLVKEKGGVVSVHPKKPRGASQEAVTHYRVLERSGDRALLAVTPETGRTHQIRAQLAHANMPVAGDDLYGGPPAPRLLLHAKTLSLKHPTSGQRFSVTAGVPAPFQRWVNGDTALPTTAREIEDRLRIAAWKRTGLFRAKAEDGAPATTAFRIANSGGDDVPGVQMDLYDRWLVVSLVSPEAEACQEAILDAAFALGPEGVYLKNRPRQARVVSDAEREARCPKVPVRGSAAPDEFLVRESGLSYHVRLGDGLQTGLFVDQRDNRRRIRELSGGATMCNLFAYTGAFTVAAAAGGAVRTVTVDVAAAPLARARKNLELLGAPEKDHTMVDVDALLWLKSAVKRGERFDVVVLDPPSFATTKTSTFSAKDDLGAVLSLALRIVAPGGRLLASTNHRGISRNRLRRAIHDAARDGGRDLWQVKDLPGSLDFPPEPGSEPAMKSVLVTVGQA
ncbi:MAG: pseudouridine synthase [Polyangiaceae bacterium]